MKARTPRRTATGLTLIELIVTLAVVAILATLATPSLAELIRSNRVSSQTNEIIAMLHFARNAAIRENPLQGAWFLFDFNPTEDSTGGTAFVLPPDGVDDNPCPTENIRCLTINNVSLSLSGVDKIRFDNRGYLVDTNGALATASGRLQLRHVNTTQDRHARCVRVTRVGQVTSTPGSCP